MLRLPEGITGARVRKTGVDILQRELLEEKAAALGRAGRAIESRLKALRESSDDEARRALVQSAADAVHALIVQRELCGIMDYQAVLDEYRVPGEVIARIGARPKA